MSLSGKMLFKAGRAEVLPVPRPCVYVALARVGWGRAMTAYYHLPRRTGAIAQEFAAATKEAAVIEVEARPLLRIRYGALPGTFAISKSPDLPRTLSRNDTLASATDLLVAMSVFHHEIDALKEIDVAEDVAFHGNDVGVFTGAD